MNFTKLKYERAFSVNYTKIKYDKATQQSNFAKVSMHDFHFVM